MQCSVLLVAVVGLLHSSLLVVAGGAEKKCQKRHHWDWTLVHPITQLCSHISSPLSHQHPPATIKREVEAIVELPEKRRGRPLLIGEELEDKVKWLLTEIRKSGGVVNSQIAAGAAKGVIKARDANLLAENGVSTLARIGLTGSLEGWVL